MATSALSSVSANYMHLLQTHYLETTAVQAFCLVGLGDLLAQVIERQSSSQGGKLDELDTVRTLRMAMLGLFIGGLGTATWLRYLEAQFPGNNMQLIVEKACLDATIWAPIANTLYLVLTPLLEGESPEYVKERLEEQFAGVMTTELCTFLPYNLISFSLIPPLVRPFTTGFISMCFAVYISWTTHSHAGDAAPNDQDGDEPSKTLLSARRSVELVQAIPGS